MAAFARRLGRANRCKGREVKFVRQRANCKECPLRDRRRVWGQGSFSSKIAVLGEAPGATEDREGKPFVGKAGATLRGGLAATGTNPNTVYYLNLIACRPPNNNLSSFEGQEAIECCKAGLEDELAWLQENGIRVLITAGNHPTHALGIEGAIGKVRGSVYETNPT